MADVCLICSDRRLERGLTLALEDMGFSVGDRESARVVLLEAGAVPDTAIPAGTPVIVIGRQVPPDLHGATYLHRPVDRVTLEQTVRAELTAFPPPILSHSDAVPADPAPASCPPLSLTPTEQGLYTALLAADGAPVSRETLSRSLPHGDGDGLLAVHICSLRRKLAANAAGRISAVRGVGYRLVKE